MENERAIDLRNLLRDTQGFADGEAMPPEEVRALIGRLTRHVISMDNELFAIRCRRAARSKQRDPKPIPPLPQP